jgi:hypothetical protein
MAVGVNIPNFVTDVLMFFTTFTSFAILALAISPPIQSIWFWRELKPPQMDLRQA